MIRPILKMGEVSLFEPSKKVERFGTPELHALLDDLRDTMQAANGAGIAAPQIGVNLQVVVFGADAINPRYPDALPVPRGARTMTEGRCIAAFSGRPLIPGGFRRPARWRGATCSGAQRGTS